MIYWPLLYEFCYCVRDLRWITVLRGGAESLLLMQDVPLSVAAICGSSIATLLVHVLLSEVEDGRFMTLLRTAVALLLTHLALHCKSDFFLM